MVARGKDCFPLHDAVGRFLLTKRQQSFSFVRNKNNFTHSTSKTSIRNIKSYSRPACSDLPVLTVAIPSTGITGVIMLIEYLAILIYVAIAVAFALFAVVASALLGQRKPTALKQAPYECGVTSFGSSFRRIPIKYYIIAMLFLLFDIEVVFLYPWAVVFKEFKTFAFISMAVFVGILVIAYIYIWKKGALEWE
jgi:NADH-quinone oxidoreductase subunit A